MVNSAPETWHFKTRRLSPFSRHVIALFSILLFDECWKRNPPPPPPTNSLLKTIRLYANQLRGGGGGRQQPRAQESFDTCRPVQEEISGTPSWLGVRYLFIYIYIFFRIFLCGRGLVRCTSASMKGQQREVEAGSSRRGTVRKRRRRRRSREKKASKRM